MARGTSYPRNGAVYGSRVIDAKELGDAVCRVGRRCFPHSAQRLDRAEAEAQRLQMVYDSRLSYAEKQPVSPAWINQAAEELATARRQLQKRQIEFASTARGAHNLLLEVHALEECGQHDRAGDLRRLVIRGMAKRRAADISENPERAHNWTPPQIRGGGERCPACGQFIGAAHRCPPAILEARRNSLQTTGDVPHAQAGATDAGLAAASELSDRMYQHIPITTAEDADAIIETCLDDRYGPPLEGLPDIPYGPDGKADTDSPEFAAYRDAALLRAHEACFEDEYIDGEPVPVVLSQGAMEPFAVPAKREAANRLVDELVGVDDRDLFDHDECAALADPDKVQWGSSGYGLCWRTGNDQPWRQIGSGERVYGPPNTSVDPSQVPVLARRTIASQTMAAWAAHTEQNVSPVALQTQAAVRDLFLSSDTDASTRPDSLDARRARAVVRAQYDLTQRYLAEQSISEVTVSRGMWFATDGSFPAWVPPEKGARHSADVTLNPAASFTVRSEVASYFARREWDEDEYVSVRLHGTVPAARVLSLPRTGMGCLAEEELVVIGGGGQWEVERV